MRRDRWLQIKPVLLGLALLAAVLVLGWLLRDVVRQFVATPLLFLMWIFRIVSMMVPKWLVWAFLLMLGYGIAVGSLRQAPFHLGAPTSGSPPSAERRVSVLSRWIANTQRPFSRHRLNITLTELAIDIYALRRHHAPQDIKGALRRGELDLPEEHKQYLQNGLSPWPFEPKQKWWKSSSNKQADSAAAIQKAKQVLDYLEEQMEVAHDRDKKNQG